MQVLYNLGNSAEDTDNRLVFYLAPKINDEW
jgi:hypothetical protein